MDDDEEDDADDDHGCQFLMEQDPCNDLDKYPSSMIGVASTTNKGPTNGWPAAVPTTDAWSLGSQAVLQVQAVSLDTTADMRHHSTPTESPVTKQLQATTVVTPPVVLGHKPSKVAFASQAGVSKEPFQSMSLDVTTNQEDDNDNKEAESPATHKHISPMDMIRQQMGLVFVATPSRNKF